MPPAIDEPAGLAVPVTEERLELGREVVDTGRTLRLRKEVDAAPQRVSDSVLADVVVVERVPVGRVVREPPAVREEGDVLVVPVVQERLVTHKELVLVEEVRLVRRRETRPVQADVVLRRERVVAERFDPEQGEWRPEPDR